LLIILQRLPRDAELLAVEPGFRTLKSAILTLPAGFTST